MTLSRAENFDAWQKLAGMVCVCAPGCTIGVWCDGPIACLPKCEPCRRMGGREYQPPPKGGKK